MQVSTPRVSGGPHRREPPATAGGTDLPRPPSSASRCRMTKRRKGVGYDLHVHTPGRVRRRQRARLGVLVGRGELGGGRYGGGVCEARRAFRGGGAWGDEAARRRAGRVEAGGGERGEGRG